MKTYLGLAGIVVALVVAVIVALRFSQDEAADFGVGPWADAGESEMTADDEARGPGRVTRAVQAADEGEPEAAMMPSGAAPNRSVESLLFRCVDRDTRTSWTPKGTRAYLLEATARVDSTMADLLERGQRFEFNAAGEVRVPRAEGPSEILVFGGRYWGRGVVPARSRGPLDEPAPILISPLREIEVEVVDEEGKALPDMPVAWRRVSSRVVDRGSPDLSRALTDRRGRAMLALPADGMAPSGRRDIIALCGLFEPPVEQQIDLAAEQLPLIRLVAPAHGFVRVRLTAPENLKEVDLSASIAVGPKGSGDRSFRGLPIKIRKGRSEPVLSGLGLDLVLRAAPPYRFGVKSRFFYRDGPQKAGEEVEWPIEFPDLPEVPILRGRVFRSDGRPAETMTRIVMQQSKSGHPRGGFNSGRLVLDAGGRFELRLDALEGESVSSWWLCFGLEEEGQLVMDRVLTLAAPPPGYLELGDVHLEDIGILAAGRVVDARGAGVSGARIFVMRDPKATDDLAPALERRLPDSIAADAEGRFELRAGDPGWPLVIRAARPEPLASTRTQAFTAGDRDLVLAFSEEETMPKGKLRLLVVTPDRANLKGLSWSLDHNGEAKSSGPLRADGLFQLSVAEGLYDLQIRDDHEPESPLRVYREVVVRREAMTDLGKLELDRRLREIEVEIEGFDLQNVPEMLRAKALIEIKAHDIATGRVVGHVLAAPDEARVKMTVTRSIVDLEAAAPGHVVDGRREVAGGTKVELRAAPKER